MISSLFKELFDIEKNYKFIYTTIEKIENMYYTVEDAILDIENININMDSVQIKDYIQGRTERVVGCEVTTKKKQKREIIYFVIRQNILCNKQIKFKNYITNILISFACYIMANFIYKFPKHINLIF